MDDEEHIPLMPMLFVGHGSPTNATEENEFTRGWRNAANSIPLPSAILCISAHWETDGVKITSGTSPITVHDFGGFPQELNQINYPAPGNPPLAKHIRECIGRAIATLDNQQGFDHGCWVPLIKMFPEADIPLLQLSLDYNARPSKHYEMAKRLATLRRKGVLIIGSGNIIHNLRMVNAGSLAKLNYPDAYPWAAEISEVFKEKILSYDHHSLIQYEKLGKAARYAVPSPDHFLPLLYILALQQEDELVSFFNDVIVAGSLSMTSIMVGGSAG